MLKPFFVLIVLLLSSISLANPQDDSRLISKYFFEITGKPLSLKNPNRSRWLTMFENNQRHEVIQEMILDPSFIDYTAYSWAIRYLNAESSPNLELNDALALIIGIIRDERNAKDFLLGNYAYSAGHRLGFGYPSVSSNAGYLEFERRLLSFSKLSYIPYQWEVQGFNENAGILTTRWWGEKYYQAGTNRRAVVGLLNVFMCRPIDAWKTSLLSTKRIRQDVPRDPSQDPRIFQTECRSCHAPMDALAGAFAHLDFKNNTLVYNRDISKKYFNNSHTYPEGYKTIDNSWKNLLVVRDDLGFGWGTRVSGKGLIELSQMIVESDGFGRCLAKRTVSHFCHKNLDMNDPWIQDLGSKLKSEDSYNLKSLFAEVLLSRNCIN
jgi:hypothetical protein